MNNVIIKNDNLLYYVFFSRNNIVLYRPKHLSNKFEPDFVVFDGEESTLALDTWITSN